MHNTIVEGGGGMAAGIKKKLKVKCNSDMYCRC